MFPGILVELLLKEGKGWSSFAVADIGAGRCRKEYRDPEAELD